MVARDKFKIGQRVQLSKLGKRRIAMDGSSCGYVVGFPSRDAVSVMIEPDHYPAMPSHMDHWEPVDVEHLA